MRAVATGQTSEAFHLVNTIIDHPATYANPIVVPFSGYLPSNCASNRLGHARFLNLPRKGLLQVGSTDANAYGRSHTSIVLPLHIVSEPGPSKPPRPSPQLYRTGFLISLISSLEPTGTILRLYFHFDTFKLPQCHHSSSALPHLPCFAGSPLPTLPALENRLS